MNTVQLECFLAVTEHLNFSKASKALKITQPAVSHQIQTLEEELGVKLFVRTSKSVTLTQEGALFLPDAQLILRTALSARERLGRHEHFLPLELGCHTVAEADLLAPVLGELAGHFPLLRPDVHLVPSPSLLTLVENDQLHACLAFKGEQKKSSLVFRELCAAPLACYCAPDHPLAGRDTLVKRDLAGSFIACSPRQIPDSIFAIQNGILASLPPGQRYFASSIESALTLVKAGLGYTLFPALPLARTDGLRCIPVTGLPAVPYGVYYQRRNDHPVLRQFLTLLARNGRPEIFTSD